MILNELNVRKLLEWIKHLNVGVPLNILVKRFLIAISHDDKPKVINITFMISLMRMRK